MLISSEGNGVFWLCRIFITDLHKKEANLKNQKFAWALLGLKYLGFPEIC